MNTLETPRLGQTTANTPIVLSVIENKDTATKPVQIAVFAGFVLVLIVMIASCKDKR